MADIPHSSARRAAARDLFAYLFVGGGAALAYVFASKFVLGLNLPVADWLVGGLLYGAFVPIVYLAHRLISFRSEAPHSYALPRYLAVQAGALLVASGMSYVVYHVLNLQPGIGSAIVIVASSGFSFVALRGWAFAEKALATA